MAVTYFNSSLPYHGQCGSQRHLSSFSALPTIRKLNVRINAVPFCWFTSL